MSEKIQAVGTGHFDPQKTLGDFIADLLQQAIRNDSDLIEFDVPAQVNGRTLLFEFRLAIRGLLDKEPNNG